MSVLKEEVHLRMQRKGRWGSLVSAVTGKRRDLRGAVVCDEGRKKGFFTINVQLIRI